MTGIFQYSVPGTPGLFQQALKPADTEENTGYMLIMFLRHPTLNPKP